MSQERMNKAKQKQTHNPLHEVEQEVAVSQRPWYRIGRRAQLLLILYTIQLVLFGLLAFWVHFNPLLPLDITITREFQENNAPWLRVTMFIISYPGSTLLLPALVVLTTVIFWIVKLRLEAIFVIALSSISSLLNGALKLLVERPRPTSSLVEVFQKATGASFPSGHVMAYIAFWGLLFSFGMILFQGQHWWRIALLLLSAVFVILVGPSRVYLGDHWASDVLGSYLIGGVLLGISLWVYLKLKERGVLGTVGTKEGVTGKRT